MGPMSNGEKFRFDLSNRPHQLLDKSHLQSAAELLASYPHSLVVVLDFALRSCEMENRSVFDGQRRFLATRYDSGTRALLNIDHHNEVASRTQNFSTTHQVISAVGEGVFDPANKDQIALVNHDDADSVLALLLSTHRDVPPEIISLFAEAAKAADHTGEPNRLVNLVDSFYKTFDLAHLVPLVNALIAQEEILITDERIRRKFEKYEMQPQIITDFILAILKNEESPHGTGYYDEEAKIFRYSPHDDSMVTSRVLPITLQMGLPVSVIMTYSVADLTTNWWKISLRAGPDFPKGLTLEEMAKQLRLEQFGYGGRRDAGGMGRYRGEKTITPAEVFDLVHLFLLGREVKRR